jgi:acetylornithine deacetylase/succinyl-diaminopimelate desuccinylase-like protein
MRDDIVQLSSQLVAIDSVKPALIAGGAGEGEVARFVVEWARAAGLEAERREGTPGRPTVLLRATGRAGLVRHQQMDADHPENWHGWLSLGLSGYLGGWFVFSKA